MTSIKRTTAIGCIMFLSACASTRYITEEFLTDKYFNQKSHYYSWDGMRVHYRDEGQGPTVLLIHGISSSLHTWDDWVESMRGSFRLIRLDLPGFGLTGPHPDNQYSIDRYVLLIANLTQHLGIDKFSIAGNSLGGWIAWEYTWKYPSMVEKLILLDAAGFATPDDPPKPIRMVQKPMFKKLATRKAPRFLVRKYLKQAYGNRKLVTPQLVDRYFELNNAPGNPLAFYTIANNQYESNTYRLAEIKTPTLIMWGSEDKKWIDVQHAYLFQELLPNDKLIIYQGVGHLPMEELPQKSSLDAQQFLQEGL